ncbi:hypothetical protein [Sphingobacterium hotanense]|nr:hypothetical protein [Sphingobacterium hotanense]
MQFLLIYIFTFFFTLALRHLSANEVAGGQRSINVIENMKNLFNDQM